MCDEAVKAALAGLELAAVMIRQGRTGEAAREAQDAADVFKAVGVLREARAALLLLRGSLERHKLSAAMLDHVVALLRACEPALPGRPEALPEE